MQAEIAIHRRIQVIVYKQNPKLSQTNLMLMHRHFMQNQGQDLVTQHAQKNKLQAYYKEMFGLLLFLNANRPEDMLLPITQANKGL